MRNEDVQREINNMTTGWRKRQISKYDDDDIQEYTRPWVRLTDEEIAVVEDEYIVDYRIPAGSAWNFARAIETKIKEKNHG